VATAGIEHAILLIFESPGKGQVLKCCVYQIYFKQWTMPIVIFHIAGLKFGVYLGKIIDSWNLNINADVFVG
jgi:hypothetical protein